ncbi:hypothetical protein JNX05_23995 (plasmid) [Pseudosulfitobacter pseudonitzschiae]|nr:hypothetical protein JNX05_23995 [Pseudosulfitobacter pseudonitzschiae]
MLISTNFEAAVHHRRFLYRRRVSMRLRAIEKPSPERGADVSRDSVRAMHVLALTLSHFT